MGGWELKFRFFIKNFKHSTIPECKTFRGSDSQVCVDYQKDLKPVMLNNVSPGGDVMFSGGNIYELIQFNVSRNPFRVDPSSFDDNEELLRAIVEHARNMLYMSPETIKHFCRYYRLMSDPEKTPFPINWFKPDYQQYCLHMHWYQQNFYDRNTGKGYGGLKSRKATMELVLQSYGYPKGWFPYKLPPTPGKSIRWIPSPSVVYDMIHYKKYHNDKLVNKYIQYLFWFGFMLGPRVPSEYLTVHISDISFDENFIVIREPKKSGTRRQVYVEPSIVNGKTRMSLKNYVDHVRSKLVSQYSSDYLFITPMEGKPFTRSYLRNLLSRMGKMVYPEFQPYVMRHWFGISMLIDSWLSHHPDPLRRVQKYMGHEERSTTEGYITQAEELFRQYPYNWRKWVLKHPNVGMGENPPKSKQRQKTSVSNGKYGESKNGSAGI